MSLRYSYVALCPLIVFIYMLPVACPTTPGLSYYANTSHPRCPIFSIQCVDSTFLLNIVLSPSRPVQPSPALPISSLLAIPNTHPATVPVPPHEASFPNIIPPLPSYVCIHSCLSSVSDGFLYTQRPPYSHPHPCFTSLRLALRRCHAHMPTTL
ncbi:hypothetical protein E2C01_010755 [Portunus trituberculatus]|uniref:Uncharacterized protein n=1 Tax=Portunus trituberculatus TaxID=210409 RepID=A0A5B7D9R3_PORTR|nr:hypothetical protein [Portunus trituberculatus]